VLKFPEGATIGEAKVKVADAVKVDVRDIRLYFSGKLLKDSFLLERVVRGNLPITFSILDRKPLELLTSYSDRFEQ
jgi:hypothetical protein